MRRNSLSLTALLLFTFFASSLHAQDEARGIIARMDSLMRGKTFEGIYRMKIIRPTWQRELRFKVWGKGLDYALIRILEPARERGVAFLRIKNEMWQYVPRINRIIKIPPSMMGESWLGSDFTNDDLAKESSLVRDFEHRLVGRKRLYGQEVYVIELVPKPEAAVVWSKILYYVRVTDDLPVRAEFFDDRGELVRVIEFKDIHPVGDRRIPTRMEAYYVDRPDERTVLILEEGRFDVPIPDNLFSLQELRRAR